MKSLLEDFLKEALELLMARKVKKMEQTVKEGKVQAYWVGTTIRIDFRPWDDSQHD